jgi:Arc/MetJ family transcription regulator
MLMHGSWHHLMRLLMHAKGVAMRTTLSLDDELLAEAQRLTGMKEKSPLIREALSALIERESARRLARLGGTERELVAAPRRRSPAR